MRVFFTYSYSGQSKYKKDFLRIGGAIKKYQDVEMTTTGAPEYEEKIHLKAKQKKVDIGKLEYDNPTLRHLHYEVMRNFILAADVVIIDNTHESFRLGHEASIALQHNKPVLILSQKRDMSNYINHKFFYGAKYNQYNIEWVINNFLQTASQKLLNNRFNMFISEEQEDFLLDQSKENHMSKSEYIRNLIEKDMKKVNVNL